MVYGKCSPPHPRLITIHIMTSPLSPKAAQALPLADPPPTSSPVSVSSSTAPPEKHIEAVDSTDEENRNIKDGRKKKRKKGKGKAKDDGNTKKKTQHGEDRSSRFPWHLYPKAEDYLYSRLKEYATKDGQQRIDLKEAVWSHLVHTYGPFDGYVDEEVNSVRITFIV